MGRAKSLMTATVIGFFGVAAFLGLAVYWQDWWFGLIAFYAGSNCWNAFKAAQAVLRQEKIPRRMGLKCPSCGTAPPIGNYWGCANCRQSFDTFESGGRCPHCGTQYSSTMCLDCRHNSPVHEWTAGDWVNAAR